MSFRPGGRFREGDVLGAARLNAIEDELRRLGTVRVAGGLSAASTAGGVAYSVTPPDTVRVAQVGVSAIAALSSSTPGSGAITLYSMGGTTLAAGEPATAYNLASGTVTAGAWIIVVDVQGKWFVVFEACA